MAIKFNIKKYGQIKTEYIAYLETGNANAISLRNFESYKLHLDNDEEVKIAREKIRSPNKQEAASTSTIDSSVNLKPYHSNSTTQHVFEYWNNHIDITNGKSLKDMIGLINRDPSLDKKERIFLIKKIEEKRNLNVFQYWNERIDSSTNISKKRGLRIIENIKKTGLFSNEQKELLIEKIHNQIKKSRQTKLKKKRSIPVQIINGDSLTKRSTIIKQPKYFTTEFIIEGVGTIVIDDKNILNYMNNGTLRKLNDSQFNILISAIQRSLRCSNTPKIEKIQQKISAYHERIKQNDKKSPKLNVNEYIEKHEEKLVPELTISWHDVIFYNNKIRIETPIRNSPIWVEKGIRCKSSYNIIKGLFEEELPNIIIELNRNHLYRLKNEIDLTKAINIISRREAIELSFDNEIENSGLSAFDRYYSAAEKNQTQLLANLRKRKQKYINKLISMHTDLGYKVVPAVESLAHESSESIIKEDSFIFTITSKRNFCVSIVYENVNESRASIVFIVRKDKYKDCLQSIFNYMGDDTIKNKRETLRISDAVTQGIEAVHSINHTKNMHDWYEKIKNLY